MNDFTLDVTLYDLRIDEHLDRLIRSNDPYLKDQLEREVRSNLVSSQVFQKSLLEVDLKKFAITYGEQVQRHLRGGRRHYLTIGASVVYPRAELSSRRSRCHVSP